MKVDPATAVSIRTRNGDIRVMGRAAAIIQLIAANAIKVNEIATGQVLVGFGGPQLTVDLHERLHVERLSSGAD